MKDQNLKELTKDTRDAIITAIASNDFGNLIEKTKAVSEKDAGTFKVIVSTADQDRQGESVKQSGWDLTFYKMNPIVLWAHDYSSLPIGICNSIEVKDGKLVAEGKFAPAEANPFAQQVRKLYELGMINATSVGFIPKEFDTKADGVINKSELLEFSFVPVPANAHALRLDEIKLNNFDVAFLKTKGIEIKTIEQKGEIAARLDVFDERQKKWEKYTEVMEIMDAFCSVYFDEVTPSDDFSKLFGETLTLLQSLASGTSTEDMNKAVQKFMGDKKTIQIKEPLLAILRNHIALGDLKLAEGKKVENTEVIINDKEINSDEKEALNLFMETRSFVRMIDNSAEKLLRKFNLQAKDR